MLASGALLLVQLAFGQNTPGGSRREDSHQEIRIANWSPPAFWDGSALVNDITPFAKAQSTGINSAVSGTPLTGVIGFVAIVPCRLVDTRSATGETGAFGLPIMAARETRTIPVLSNTRCNIPPTAQAYSVNFTVVPTGFLAYLSAWPTGNPPIPLVSILNDQSGAVIANAAVVPAGLGGSFDVYVTDQTHVIIDINGYYAPISFGPVIQAPNDNSFNFAAGLGAMQSITSGTQNTAIGDSALRANTTGSFNTAIGYKSLFSNTTGGPNVALGDFTLYSNTSGSGNVALGENTMFSNTTGGSNTAVGHATLVNNTTAFQNTAIGYQAMYNNTTGASNTALGYNALLNDVTGDANTAIGFGSLMNATGSNNVAIGISAGIGVGTGSNNVDISASGASPDSGVIRIGTSGTQSKTFIAGIQGVTTDNNNAIPVVIDSTGQLGTVSSSRRYKEDIQDMNKASSRLMDLRPVTFRYRQPYQDGSKPPDYGLIAEEVAQVYPDLVVRGTDGQVETVQYQKLTPMLLNELQKQHKQIQEAGERIRLLESRLAALEGK